MRFGSPEVAIDSCLKLLNGEELLTTQIGNLVDVVISLSKEIL